MTRSHSSNSHNPAVIRLMTYLMFLMFAMTTDAVGEIIKVAREELNLSLTQAGAFHYAPMLAIAIAGIGFGFLADRYGHKPTIMAGLGLFAAASIGFLAGHTYWLYLSLLFISGIAIGIFKTAALALIGDISASPAEHTRTMNMVEGFFGIGAIIGPLLVVALMSLGISWKYLYLLAGGLCFILILAAYFTHYPANAAKSHQEINLGSSLALLKDPFALGFSIAIALYVATEVAIFVWLPSLLADFSGSELANFFAAYAVMIFFTLRAAGRFLSVLVLKHLSWTLVMMLFTGVIFLCFLLSMLGGREVAVFLLPLSGLFMSMIYPTLNSKGISCFDKHEHSSAAGVLLFFTAGGAALGPLLMGLIGDWFGSVSYSFILASAFAGLLFVAMVYNHVKQPAEARLARAQS